MSYRGGLTLKVLLFVLGLFVIALVDLPGNTFYWREIQNTGHTVGFGVLAILLLWIVREIRFFKSISTNYLYLSVAIICIFVGGLVEFIQALTDKDVDFRDALRNVAGIISFLGFSYGLELYRYSNLNNRNKRAVLTVTAVSAAVLFIAFLPLTNISIAYIKRYNCFPTILDFNRGCGEYFVSAEQAQLNVVEIPKWWKSNRDKQVAKVVLLKEYQYPGIALKEPEKDWSDYSKLNYEIYSMNKKPFKLVLRIHDESHNFEFKDRFNKAYQIQPRENLIQVSLKEVQLAPVGRKMDMKAIDALIWFSVNPKENVEFYFRKAWLD